MKEIRNVKAPIAINSRIVNSEAIGRAQKDTTRRRPEFGFFQRTLQPAQCDVLYVLQIFWQAPRRCKFYDKVRALHQDKRRFLTEARATPPPIFGLMSNSSTVTLESST